METVSVVEKSNLLVPIENTDTLVIEQENLVAGERVVEVSVVSSDTTNLLVEVESSVVILAGQPGPAGAPSEDTIMYSKRVDFVSENMMYKGEATPGASESDSVWRICRVEILGDNDVITKWAYGSASFSYSWTDRGTYSYV